MRLSAWKRKGKKADKRKELFENEWVKRKGKMKAKNYTIFCSAYVLGTTIGVFIYVIWSNLQNNFLNKYYHSIYIDEKTETHEKLNWNQDSSSFWLFNLFIFHSLRIHPLESVKINLLALKWLIIAQWSKFKS